MHWQVLTVALVIAAPAPPEDKKDTDKIQGTWTVVSYKVGKLKFSEEDVKMTWVFKDDRLTIKDNGNGEEGKIKIKMDSTRKPKTIDMISEAKTPDGKQILGIYELKDDDLKVCYGKEGGERPTEFATKAGSETTLIVLKREKEKDK